MGLLDTLIKKRDKAYGVYQQWQGMIDALQADPDFAKVFQGRADLVVNGARARLAAPDGAPVTDRRTEKWTAERRAAHVAQMRRRWNKPTYRQKVLAALAKGRKTRQRRKAKA